jgi:hypothetical protein
VKTKGSTLLGLIISLALVGLSGCTLDQVAARQAQATGLWDELVGGESYGQSFVSTRDNLYRIDLGTATYARVNAAPVIFHLKSSPEASTDIVSITLPGAEIQNERPTSIEFPPLPDSRGQSYYFSIESPEGAPGDAITVYANANDQYPDGEAYRNGQAVPGDLAFTAYSRQTFTLSRLLHDFLSRAAQDVPFFVCYGVLILGVCAGILGSLGENTREGIWPGSRTGGDSSPDTANSLR